MRRCLEVNNLEINFKTYAGTVYAVRDVSFYLDEGETLAIVGESGCGKTVTSKGILKLLPKFITEIPRGSIKFNGRELLYLKEKEMNQIRGEEISMIFQDPMTSLNPTMTIGDQIKENLIIHKKLNRVEAERETVEILKMVNIPEVEKRIGSYPHEFSGGMRQRVMIAIAISCSPKILIADESTTALDVTIQAQILNLMKKIQKEIQMGIILITHDLGVVARIADRIQVMYAGKIVETGATKEIFKNPKHPYTLALLKSIPAFNSSKKSELYAIKGTPLDLISPPKGCAFAKRCDYVMKICQEIQPENFEISKGHISSCWLEHKYMKEGKDNE